MLSPSVNCRSPPSAVHLRDRAATWEKSVCATIAGMCHPVTVPAKDPRMFSWGFTASKWDIPFFLSMVSTLGLRGYFYILAKAQTASFATVAISEWICASLEPLIHDLSLHVPTSPCPLRNDSNMLGMVLTPITPAFGRQRQEDLEFQASLKYRLRPSSRDQVGAGQTKDL